jgi:hypothetical protein
MTGGRNRDGSGSPFEIKCVSEDYRWRSGAEKNVGHRRDTKTQNVLARSAKHASPAPRETALRRARPWLAARWPGPLQTAASAPRPGRCGRRWSAPACTPASTPLEMWTLSPRVRSSSKSPRASASFTASMTASAARHGRPSASDRIGLGLAHATAEAEGGTAGVAYWQQQIAGEEWHSFASTKRHYAARPTACDPAADRDGDRSARVPSAPGIPPPDRSRARPNRCAPGARQRHGDDAAS